jgi:rfaE bifunctional protein kinase chain/domain
MEHNARLETILSRFAGQRILVLGDLILDRYWWGDTSRLSPEAPVPVLRKRNATARPGGAANAAANLAALGASVELIGLVGTDDAAAELSDALSRVGVASGRLLQTPGRPTTTKTRIVAHNQHVVRVDEEDTTPLAQAQADEVCQQVASLLDDVSSVVISDYAKGFLTPPLLQEIIQLASKRNKPTFVDPKGSDFIRYSGATLLKPNRSELSLLTHLPVRDHQETVIAANYLLPKLDNTYLLVTEGEDGMTLFRPSAPAERMQSTPRQVYDVTGAGDTVVATFTMSLAAGASFMEAMRLSANAAAIAISMVGTATVSVQAIRDVLRGDPVSGEIASQSPA